MGGATYVRQFDDRSRLQTELVEAGLLSPSGVPILCVRGGTFETVIEHFGRLVTRYGDDQDVDVTRSRQLLSREAHERTDHMESMPQLLDANRGFDGDERSHSNLVSRAQAGEDWTSDLSATDVMLVPSICYPLNPSMTGTSPEAGRVVDLRTFVFRHES